MVVKKILVVTSVEAEKIAIQSALKDDERFHIETIGVGPMSASAKTAEILSKDSYDVVINMGVGGGIPGIATVGEIVVASEIIAADLGAESPTGFKPIEELGFGQSRWSCDTTWTKKIVAGIETNTNVPVHRGPILTLSTVTGTDETLVRLQEQYKGAAAEAMEGAGVATAASLRTIPCLEIRSVSNLVGPRDRGAWKLNEALTSLSKVSHILKEVF
ncbi:futalosine hydrolase [Salipaludibacillus keqinensis]|uniref:Futalosine hydrolase n=1 Tax=Salipaludibacillus keqinensis TaxID=2045207 RepID=A0A323T8S8_9BACI|nr:futalosine hydrolase [Salipaludibacillus keqinensis]PYZ92021.1 futalosine hydrolase [Salipaludibacillus keqinensis]